MKIPFLDLRAHHAPLRHAIEQAIAAVIDDSAFVGGKYVSAFEKAFARLHDADHAIGVGNGTDALMVALYTVGVRSGDEVITAANSFIASSEAISMLGARVVFADCDTTSYTIDPSEIERRITGRTKAVIPVHLYGHPADMGRIMRISGRRGLKVVEDVAQAITAEYRGKKVGSIGHMGAFSFYPGKNLGALGDGGALLTNREHFAEIARRYANHGRTSKYLHTIEGINSRLDGIQAAVLKVKLRYLRKWTEKRRRIARLYGDLLNSVGEICLPREMGYARHAYHLYVIRTSERDRLLRYLHRRGVEAGVHYPIALPNLPAYRHLRLDSSDYPNATRLSQEALSLPLFPEMTDGQVEYVASAVRSFFRSSAKKGRRTRAHSG